MTNVVFVLYICLIRDQRGIVKDPKCENSPQYIVKRVRMTVTVSLDTVEIVEGLAE